MGDKAQKSHTRAIKEFAAFLARSPDNAFPAEGGLWAMDEKVGIEDAGSLLIDLTVPDPERLIERMDRNLHIHKYR